MIQNGAALVNGSQSRSGGRPACRKAEASRPAEISAAKPDRLNLARILKILPRQIRAAGTPALYGRQDARRYNAFAAMSRRKCAPSKWIFSTAA